MNTFGLNSRPGPQAWPPWQRTIVAILVFLLLAILLAFYLLVRYTSPQSQPTPTQDWRLSRGYVSQEQFGDDWPFTVSEGVVACVSGGGVVLQTNRGTYGLTGYTNSLGYVNIKDSGLWRNSQDGVGKVSLSTFTSFAVRLCP